MKANLTEMVKSGEGTYMLFTAEKTAADGDNVTYKVSYTAKADGNITWDNRANVFENLLAQVPEELKIFAEAEYDRYCEGLRNAEAEAEAIANMSAEERLAMLLGTNITETEIEDVMETEETTETEE